MSDDEPPAKKSKAGESDEEGDLPECPYGERCYRKNPQHFKEYWHPKKGTDGKAEKRRRKSAKRDDNDLPPCPFGASCYRKNLLHFAEYSHPTATEKTGSDQEEGSDTDVYYSDDEKKKKTSADKGGNDFDLDKGMSLIKSYSKMTEEERKELIKKAMEAKKQLETELKQTKEKMAEKDKELNRLQQEVSKGVLLLEGEADALKGKKTVYFPLVAERSYREGSAAQLHFRLAESQFYRLLSGNWGSQYRVTKVEYVVNPDLTKKFKEAREDLKRVRGEELSLPVLAFHGTKAENITPICEGGFKVPGCKGFKHRTDTGYYGKGVYFSEYPGYSMGYIQGSQKLLLCQVLPGKVYQCTKLIHGHSLKGGYDSHTSPCKKELIIFNSYHILPSYIVYYKHGTTIGEFKYSKLPEEKKPMSEADIKKLLKKVEKAKASNILGGHTYAFAGDFICGIGSLMSLVTDHGGYVAGGHNTFSVLVCTEKEFQKKSAKVKKAATYHAPIVREEFILESIEKKAQQDFDDYSFD